MRIWNKLSSARIADSLAFTAVLCENAPHPVDKNYIPIEGVSVYIYLVRYQHLFSNGAQAPRKDIRRQFYKLSFRVELICTVQ